MTLEKARLIELTPNLKDKPGGQTVIVQFNPETLKVNFANQIQTPSGSGDQRGPQTRQFVGAGTTKLSVQLWFDVSAPQPGSSNEDDVRKLTQQVAFFITADERARPPVPPGVRFLWGTFKFDGLMESMDESLEFFSNDGRPLRASVTLNLSQQKITKFLFGQRGAGADPPGAGAPGSAAPGTVPLTPAPTGSSVQSLADAAGRGNDWQAIASANGIENPRLLTAGQLVNLNVDAPPGAPPRS